MYYLPGGDFVGLVVAPSFKITAVRRRNMNCISATVICRLFVGWFSYVDKSHHDQKFIDLTQPLNWGRCDNYGELVKFRETILCVWLSSYSLTH